jgi:hypothetical protein
MFLILLVGILTEIYIIFIFSCCTIRKIQHLVL